MADLSPAAQAVLDAVASQLEGGWISPEFIPYEARKIAAALRAAVDQVISDVTPPIDGCDQYSVGSAATHRKYRRELLAIATALAQPEPEGPTDEELLDLANDHGVSTEDIGPLVSTILTRWGCPAIESVPVEERLPGADDCDAEGECYWFDPAGTGAWYLDTYQGNYSHWLPHHALPVPTTRREEN